MDSEEPSCAKKAKFTKYCGAAKYNSKFNPKWTQTHPYIVADSTDINHFRCTVCNRSVNCKHQGWKDVERHIGCNSHKELEKIQSSTKVDLFTSFAAHNAIRDQNLYVKCVVTRAEVKVAHIIAQHNLPLATTDHLSPAFADIFPDSKIAKQYSSAKTKTTCMLNGAIAPFFRANLVDMMKTQPYSLAVDGSNDTGLEKMNPLTVGIYDVNTSKVEFRILDMCCTSGNNSATAAWIFHKINEKINVHDIPWSNCVAFGVDNTSVNLGKRNSIKTRVQEQVQSCYFVGCPCHLVHNIACKASDAFQLEVKFDVEDFCVDIFYYFDKSTKRKAILSDFCSFCDTNYKQVVKQVNTRWLSLEKAVTRNLELFEGSKSYFKSTQESQPRFKRLKEQYENPMTEIYLLFYQSVLPVFTNFNKFLQRDDPCIYAIYPQMTSFLKKLLGKFVKVEIIRKSLSVVKDVDFLPPENQLDDDNIFVGITTRDKLIALEEEGDISSRDREMFYRGARAFFVKAVSEAVQKLPWLDDHNLLKHARFVNFTERASATFEDVLFFTKQYSHVLPFYTPQQIVELQEEFTEYQLLDKSDIPEAVWSKAAVTDENDGQFDYRMDVIWGYLSQCTHTFGKNKFEKLFTVAKLVLVIPHSNAGEERVFSMVRKIKTDFRSSMSLNSTLNSLITVKLANPESASPCYKWEPPRELLKKCKSATKDYNRLHSN